jgi:DNA polymerase-1
MDIAAINKAVSAAAKSAPQSNGNVSLVKGRVLLADGDGLAYYCAGNEDTTPGEARRKLTDKLDAARAACGAERVIILLTARGSHKGYRRAVAKRKGYQAQRSGDNRQKQWAFLRELMETGQLPNVEVISTSISEADDLFAVYAATGGDYVIFTQDKDMRMVPGLHLDWVTHLMFRLDADAPFHVHHNDKRWGRGWFWQQMLHGDNADNIPGLPFYRDGTVYSHTHKDKEKRGQIKDIPCGEKASAVVDVLPNLSSDAQCIIHIGALYNSCYDDRWVVEMLEQGILLWMRPDREADPFSVCHPGAPLAGLINHDLFPAARAEIEGRIAEAKTYETNQDDGSRDGAASTAAATARDVCAVPPAVQCDGSGAGSRPLDGRDPSNAAPVVQLAAGQGGEQPQAVRNQEPRRVPAWARSLLAKAPH